MYEVYKENEDNYFKGEFYYIRNTKTHLSTSGCRLKDMIIPENSKRSIWAGNKKHKQTLTFEHTYYGKYMASRFALLGTFKTKTEVVEYFRDLLLIEELKK